METEQDERDTDSKFLKSAFNKGQARVGALVAFTATSRLFSIFLYNASKFTGAAITSPVSRFVSCELLLDCLFVALKFQKLGALYNNIESIFDVDKFIFPVHEGNTHWYCAVINLTEEQFEYYNSSGSSSSSTFFRAARRYLMDEYNDKLNSNRRKFKLELSRWTDKVGSNYPQQQNGFDCGVYTCACANLLSLGLPMQYTPDEITSFRRRMLFEIITGQIGAR